MIEMGLIVALGLLVMLAKLPWRWKLWIVSHPVSMDLVIFISMLMIHRGTFSGVMVATIGAFACSITLSIAKRVIGHYDNRGVYVRGFFDVTNKIVRN